MKETLYIETDKDLTNVGRVIIGGKNNVGLEFYTGAEMTNREKENVDSLAIARELANSLARKTAKANSDNY